MAVAKQTQVYNNVRGGMNDSLFATEVDKSQVSLAQNCDLTWEGILEMRGGSICLSDTATGATDRVYYVHGFYTHASSGLITRRTLIKAGSALYQYNSVTGLFVAVDIGVITLGSGKPSIVNFLNGAGIECIIYADGTAFFMYDGTTVTNLLTAWQAGGFTSAPKYLAVYADVLWAAGDTYNPSMVGFSNDLDPTVWNIDNNFTFEAGGGDIVLGLCKYYDYLAVGKNNSIHMITGRSVDDFRQFNVLPTMGISSHWSLQAVGVNLFWANTTGFYVGTLRATSDSGMDADRISGNVQRRFDSIDVGTHGEIDSVYDPRFGQLYWSYQTAESDYPNEVLVLSVWHSTFGMVKAVQGPDLRYAWSGVWTGLQVCSIGLVEDSNGILQAYCGGNDGKIRLLNSGLKDNRKVGESTGTKIDWEIDTRQKLYPGRSYTVRRFFPVIFMAVNESISCEWVADDSVRLPVDIEGAAASVTLKHTGNTPYWNDGSDTDITTEWGTTIWTARPLLQAQVTINRSVYSIQFILIGLGLNDDDDYAYAGEVEEDQMKLARGRG